MLKKHIARVILVLFILLTLILYGCSNDMGSKPSDDSDEVKHESNTSVIVLPPMDSSGHSISPEDSTSEPIETAEPLPSPSPSPEPVLSGIIPESEPADDSYWDDTVFVGDSISLMLKYYARDEREKNPSFLGKAEFLTSGSFGYRNAILPVSESSVHPSYQGTKMTVEEAIEAIGAKKAYIMLGMNDVANKNYKATLENLDTLVDRIREKSPDIVFYFESMTPRMEDSQTEKLNNDVIRGFNELLLQHCIDNGYYYVNVYEAIADTDGNLPAEYCSDPISAGSSCMGIHMTYEGCRIWTDYLYTHTA